MFLSRVLRSLLPAVFASALSLGAHADTGTPELLIYTPPAGIGESSAEPSIGFNQKTRKAFFLGGSDPVFQVTFPDEQSPVQPAECPAEWKNVDSIYADGATLTLDPILFTDQTTGRTFVSQLILATSRFAYTDDDGATWTPGQLGGPPTGAIDHQTVGAGPYPASVPLGNPLNLGSAVYYCSQNGFAMCQRSDNGGLTFGPGVPAYTGTTDSCSNFHGHLKVSRDGTVYLPNGACGEHQALSVSEDAGITWSVRHVTPSTPVPGKWDPSLGVADDNTLYFCRADADGHIRVAVSEDHGQTWINDFDVGAAYGLENGAFTQAVAGDGDRAACAFLGTTAPGNYEAQDFEGVWYGYVAYTYDRGKTWTTLEATPGNPIQREGGICISGTGCTGGNRNLLDFNEVAIDDKGRVLFAYADGCEGSCADFSGENTRDSFARIARQARGKSLYARFDDTDLSGPTGTCPAGAQSAPAAAVTAASKSSGSFGGALGLLTLLPLLATAALRSRR